MSTNKKEDLILDSINKRGKVLHECILLEKRIEGYIAHYFCQDRDTRIDFFVIILDRMTFDAKIATFETILKNKNDKAVFTKMYRKLMSELRFVKDERNKYAHYMVDNITESNVEKFPKELTLVSFRNSTTYYNITNEVFENLLKRIKRCQDEIFKIRKELIDSRPSPTI